MLLIYHCAEMESPLKDITAACLLKYRVDDGPKGLAVSTAGTESFVQLWNWDNYAAPTF